MATNEESGFLCFMAIVAFVGGVATLIFECCMQQNPSTAAWAAVAAFFAAMYLSIRGQR